MPEKTQKKPGAISYAANIKQESKEILDYYYMERGKPPKHIKPKKKEKEEGKKNKSS